MKQQNASAQRGTKRAGRWFARALLVVGGAVAGTAAAWALSTASASAETAHPALPQDGSTVRHHEQDNPVTDATFDAGDTLLGSKQFADHATATAAHFGTGVQSPDRIARGRKAASEFTGAVHNFGQHVVVQPAHQLLGSTEQIASRPQDAPRVISEALTPPRGILNLLRPTGNALVKLPVLTGARSVDDDAPAVPPVALDPVAPAPTGPMGPIATALPHGHADTTHFTSRQESGGHQHGDRSGKLPFDPTHSPAAPSGLPYAPGGSPVGGHIDGLLLGVPASALTVADVRGLRAARFGIRHTPVEPGMQPGVTPD